MTRTTSPHVLAAVALSLVALPGCTAEIKEENNALQSRILDLEKDLAHLEEANAQLKLRLSDLEQSQANSRLAASLGIKPGQRIWAQLETSLGEIRCELFAEKAPITVANFVGLAEGTKEFTDPLTRQKVKGVPYYDGVIFHRVIPGFMIQTGDRTGTGRGGPGFQIKDEFHPDLKHRPGSLSMANRGPNTGGAQFFITEVATSHLDNRHSIFGQCEPLSVIKDIAHVERGPGDKPLKDVVLKTVTIHRGDD